MAEPVSMGPFQEEHTGNDRKRVISRSQASNSVPSARIGPCTTARPDAVDDLTSWSLTAGDCTWNDAHYVPATYFQNHRIPVEQACYTCHEGYVLGNPGKVAWLAPCLRAVLGHAHESDSSLCAV